MCEFLPPYSPDLNPIELAFLAMKYHLHRNGDYIQMAMTEMMDEDIHITLIKALYIILPQDSYGWYSHWIYLSQLYIILLYDQQLGFVLSYSQ